MAAGTYNPTLADDDFRARRFYLPAEAFALVTGPYAVPTDPVPEEQWHELMNLPTDVLLRTSDHRGSQLTQLSTLWSWWVQLLPLELLAAPFIFSVGWDAAEDFNLSTFNAAHGYYPAGHISPAQCTRGPDARRELHQAPERGRSASLAERGL